MFFLKNKKVNVNKRIEYKNLLKEKIAKLSISDLFFIRNEIFLELKKRGVFKCSK